VFTTIAWATDGSASASDALPVAEGLARAIGGNLVIVYVQEVTISRFGFLTEDNRAVLASLHRTARRLRDDGVHATVLTSKTTTHNVPRKILDLVSTAQADILIIGNRRHGSVLNLLLGSVANRLLRTAPLPIITVPSQSTATTRSPWPTSRRAPRGPGHNRHSAVNHSATFPPTPRGTQDRSRDRGPRRYGHRTVSVTVCGVSPAELPT
jgi:nucleotide-binding universal stress UspA family protein